jgi:hypothetical protein
MTDTLLREFEEWLQQYKESDGEEWWHAIGAALVKLEELKKKYGQTTTST